MSIWRKVGSVGLSATLLASLFATVVASTALAAVTVTSAGSVPRGDTSANAATFTFTEETAGCVTTQLGAAASASFAVTITPHAPGAGTVKFTGTPTLAAPGSLGASVTVDTTAGNFFTVKITGSDPVNKQQITVSGLKIKASATATLGSIVATLSNTTGTVAGCFLAGTGHPTGTLTAGIGIGATSVTVAVADTSCPFDTAPPLLATVAFATSPETVGWTASTALNTPALGQQTLTIAATANVHNAGETVTGSTTCPTPTVPATIGSPGTVVDVAVQDVPAGAATVAPGENNQNASSTTLTENAAGFIPVGTLTFTLSAAGVQFSASPTVSITSGGLQQTITVAALANAHGAGETVTQTHTACTSTGTLNAATIVGATTIVVNETVGCPFTITAGTDGVVNVGVALVTAESVAASAVAGSGMTLGSNVCGLSFDRTSCSVSVTHVSTSPSTITLSGIKLDVASTVTAGTAVNINITSSPAIAISITANTIANVARVIVGTAAQPTIFINYNDQPSGMITLAEAGAGFFVDGSATTGANVFALCEASGESFTRAPWAVVTVGDLKLLSGLVGAASVQGTLFTDPLGHSCVKWFVYTASTVASTIEIRGSDSAGAVLPSGANNGPRLSVPGTLKPGTTQSVILIGTNAQIIAGVAVAANGTVSSPGGALSSLVSNAVRAYKSGVVVAAVSQPTIPAGSADSLAGNITITETLNGQFKPGEVICVHVLPRTSNGTLTQDTLLKTASTNDLPVISTNTASGLLASTVGSIGCSGTLGATFQNSFNFTVTQQSFGTLGVITISNIHYITTADAPNGAVLVDVSDVTTPAAGVVFESVVSNAVIGAQAVADAWIAKGGGVRAASAFTVSTVIVKQGTRVTIRVKISGAAPGTLVQFWVKTKTTAWRLESSRRITTDGFAYYSPKVLNRGYRYYRGAGAGAISNAVRAFGKK